MGLDFTVVPKFLDVILLGALWTIAITVGGGHSELLRRHHLRGDRALRATGRPAAVPRLFAWLFMGTPLLLQLFLIYFGLIQIGIDLPAFVAGVIGLGLHFAVYNSELIQAAILAVDKGQMEAARTLGLSAAARRCARSSFRRRCAT